MNGHPIREEDFDLHALGMLEGQEGRELAAHLAGCAECTRLMQQARARMALLALAAPAAAPSPEVKARLMQRVRESAGSSPVPASARTWTPAPAASWWTSLWAPAALALALATLILWVQNNRVNRELAELRRATTELQDDAARNRALAQLLTSPDTVQIALASPAPSPAMRGHIQYNQRKGALIYTGTLPPLPAGKSYQLWLVPVAGNPISAGVFSPDATGRTAIVLPPLQAGITAKAFAVTIEPAGGSPGPTGSKVLIGAVA